MIYRCAILKEKYQLTTGTFEVVNIARDEGQKEEYGELANWCKFTFSEIPPISKEIWDWAHSNDYSGSLNVVENNIIRAKTLLELNNE